MASTYDYGNGLGDPSKGILSDATLLRMYFKGQLKPLSVAAGEVANAIVDNVCRQFQAMWYQVEVHQSLRSIGINPVAMPPEPEAKK